jgi:ABC-2 type transport system ATP-binding protein
VFVNSSELAIRARGLKKTYGHVEALRGIDLDVHRGECVSLLGPNGAGKTTATEIFEGYRLRDSGEVSVLGVDPSTGGQQWRSRLGIVLQSAGDLRELKVVEAVRHFSKYFENPADVDSVISSVGLSEKRLAKVRELSGGQRRRLDVALGVIGNPELLFLDEPTTGFDPEARRQFWTLIEDLKSRGVTILLTTHYLDEAEVLADRVAIISSGKVVADQTPSSLRAEALKTASVSWLEAGITQQVSTQNPTALTRELLNRFDGEVPELSITRPSLEDVYLHLVGASQEEVAK